MRNPHNSIGAVILIIISSSSSSIVVVVVVVVVVVEAITGGTSESYLLEQSDKSHEALRTSGELFLPLIAHAKIGHLIPVPTFG